MGTETNQIIPFYAQPHTHTVIIDRTQYDETVATPVSGDDLPFATLVVTGSHGRKSDPAGELPQG